MKDDMCSNTRFILEVIGGGFILFLAGLCYLINIILLNVPNILIKKYYK